VYSCGPEEPNALIQLESGARTVPSTRATVLELYEGLQCWSHAGWPRRTWDLGRALDLTSRLWAAGFYNKTFLWPNWRFYERWVRRMAASARAPVEPDPDRYEVQNLHCEVLVIGAGVAGLTAAKRAAASGVRVVLADSGADPGGRCLWDGSTVDGEPGAAWVHESVQWLQKTQNVRILCRTTAMGYYEKDVVALSERVGVRGNGSDSLRERYWIVRADRVVLATGSIEQPLVFCNNDRPGILLAGSAHQYLRRYGVAVGHRIVVATNNDSIYGLVRDLAVVGTEVAAVVDTRKQISALLVNELRDRNIPLHLGCIPVDTQGFSTLSGVTIGRISNDGDDVDARQTIACDALALSGGWNPALQLFSQAGGRLVYREESGTLEPGSDHPQVGVTCSPDRNSSANACSASFETHGIRVSPIGPAHRKWVDLRHDVTVADLELAVRENYRSIEHVKRYTTLGMAADQGKTSHVRGIEVLASARGVKPDELGHTTLRPPVEPVTLGALAGRPRGELFAPSRRLPMHAWHTGYGAVIENFGEWQRPAVYLQKGEARQAGILREATAVRQAAGLFDGSALGKIEVHGPDALMFLNRFYINNLTTLEEWRVRYGLMLRESGVIFDDGTVVKLACDRYLLTTTSGNAERVSLWLQEWQQCEWPDLRVAILPVTEQWACLSLTGPRARDILARLETSIDLSPPAFPHLSLREGLLLGHTARIYRVSFTGELTYEINVPRTAGPEIWEALMEAGKPDGLAPIGVDSLLRLRLEKGFLHVGTDTDGTTVPDDVGWGNVARNKRADFIGKRSLSLPEHVRPDRLQLIGLTSEGDIPIGSHLRLADSRAVTDGWVTSAARTVLTGQPIALALVRGGRQQVGTEVSVHDLGNVTRARIAKPPFYDVTGARMHA
jgi:sarcosine oxidase subunit alpha